MNRKPTIYFKNTFSNVSAVESNSVLDTDWHHLAATYNGLELKIYIDAILTTTLGASGNIKNTTLPAFIGAHVSNNQQGINATAKTDYDESALFNIALTQSEIASYKQMIPTTATGMVAYFDFSDTSKVIETNKVTTSPNATISGSIRMNVGKPL